MAWNNSKEHLFAVRHVFFSSKGRKFDKISDLFGKRIVLITGFDYPELNQYIKSGRIKVIRVSDHEAAIAAIEKGRGVAFPEMDLRLKYHLSQQEKDIRNFEYNKITDVLSPYNIHLAYSRNFPKEILLDFDKKIKEIRENGTIQNIIKDYVNSGFEVY